MDKVAPIETKAISTKPINKWLMPGIKISLVHARKQYRAVKKGIWPRWPRVQKYKKELEACIRRLKIYATQMSEPDSLHIWTF